MGENMHLFSDILTFGFVFCDLPAHILACCFVRLFSYYLLMWLKIFYKLE